MNPFVKKKLSNLTRLQQFTTKITKLKKLALLWSIREENVLEQNETKKNAD